MDPSPCGAAIGEGFRLLMTRGAGLRSVERKPLVIEKVAAELDLLFGHGIVGRHVGEGKAGRQIPLVRAKLGFFDDPLPVA